MRRAAGELVDKQAELTSLRQDMENAHTALEVCQKDVSQLKVCIHSR